MKTLLIPVDFTPASENAVRFAIEWSQNYFYERIILAKSFYSSMYENVIMAGEFANVDQNYLNNFRAHEKEKLNKLCESLVEKTNRTILVQSSVSELPLIRMINQIIKSERPEMIVMGNDRINNSNSSFVSGNVIAIAKSSPVRVLVIPANCTYQPVHRVLVPCDFDKMESLNKINSLPASPRWDDVMLFVLNVDSKKDHLKPDEKLKTREAGLHDYLKNFKHKIFYAGDKNVIRGILNFTKLKEMQMMFALPGRYSFLYALTHKSISEALYQNTVLPVMILK